MYLEPYNPRHNENYIQPPPPDGLANLQRIETIWGKEFWRWIHPFEMGQGMTYEIIDPTFWELLSRAKDYNLVSPDVIVDRNTGNHVLGVRLKPKNGDQNPRFRGIMTLQTAQGENVPQELAQVILDLFYDIPVFNFYHLEPYSRFSPDLNYYNNIVYQTIDYYLRNPGIAKAEKNSTVKTAVLRVIQATAVCMLGLLVYNIGKNVDLSKVTTALVDYIPSAQADEDDADPPPETVEGGSEGQASPEQTQGLSPIFTPQVQHWGPQILAWSEQFGLDPNIIATIMQIESCGDPNAVSSAGARGLFQVMPFHFADGEDPRDPNTNARRGMNFYNTMLAHTGDIYRAFAGYNGGYAAADNPYDAWPNESQRYFYWAKGIYDDAKSGAQTSPRLEEWLAAGGSGLCAQANSSLGLQ